MLPLTQHVWKRNSVETLSLQILVSVQRLKPKPVAYCIGCLSPLLRPSYHDLSMKLALLRPRSISQHWSRCKSKTLNLSCSPALLHVALLGWRTGHFSHQALQQVPLPCKPSTGLGWSLIPGHPCCGHSRICVVQQWQSVCIIAGIISTLRVNLNYMENWVWILCKNTAVCIRKLVNCVPQIRVLTFHPP